MKLKKANWVGIIFGTILIILSAIFFLGKDSNILLFLVGIGVGIIVLPFVTEIAFENKKEKEINSMFLEFTRNLAESVSAGTPISKSIQNMSKRNYGPLTAHVKKLANQIELGIPVHKAMNTFARDINSPVIERAIGLIREAERAGGEIDYILDSVAKSISEIDKLKKERKSAVSNLVVQGYIIFFIFIGIMLVMQFKVLPLTAGIGSFDVLGGDIGNIQNINTTSNTQSVEQLGRSFLYLLLFQGLFAGLTIGKLSEGNIKSGIKHSFIMMIAAFLISTGANIVFG